MQKDNSSSFLKNNRLTILTTLFIGLTFFWTSSAYLSWTGHLTPLANSTVTYMATEAGGAIAQAVGIFLFAWLLHYDIRTAIHSKIIAFAMILDGVSILPILLSGEMLTVLVWGVIMNLFHGAIAGYYISHLSYSVPKNRRAFCFGVGYAIGNIGSYLISLADNSLLSKDGFLYSVYVFFILACIILNFYTKRTCLSDESAQANETDSDIGSAKHITPFAVPYFSCVLAGFVVILLGLTMQLLFFFPAQAYISNTVILEFSHLFYTVGLVIAALVNDKKRSAGLILALLSLCFPLLSLSLYQIPQILTLLSAIGYGVMGFHTVFRIVVFTDLYDNDIRLLWLAPAGLFCGRIGEAAGSALGFGIGSKHVALSVTTALLFVITTVSVFLLYVRLYSAKPVTTVQDRANRFYAEYELSVREQQVFLLLADGKSNQEIAETLFISENTVKFHVRNILKKTNCQKRADIIRKFQVYS